MEAEDVMDIIHDAIQKTLDVRDVSVHSGIDIWGNEMIWSTIRIYNGKPFKIGIDIREVDGYSPRREK